MANLLEEMYRELPGTAELPPPPRERYETVRQRRGDSYQPRTRHLRPDGMPRYTNRLFLESSPYLLQHAHNPVNWFPWGEEAFDLARQLDRPVLVSIGYATCHWCHVMEEESFENEEMAGYLNQHFIAIKVDREERPDVDTVYMTALHAMGVQGGWPLNVFLTPQRHPFYGGTYFPPFDHSRGIGFLSLLKRLAEAYHGTPERVTQAGLQLTEAVRGMLQPPPGGEIAASTPLRVALRECRERFDRVNGGAVGFPKFPSSLPVRLLLRGYLAEKDPDLVAMAELTLRRMAEGGIYDQVAGGFHRYATDETWLVPHFEKMLYDNAQLAVTYLEGYQLTGERDLARVVREILRYLQRDMSAPGGALYAATDADSLAPNGKREEGYFFTWTPEEVLETLGEERAAVFSAVFGIERGGNFEGRSIPHRSKSMVQVARELDLPGERVAAIIEESREILYQARRRRPLPLRDEKVLAAWNGLALSALARAGLLLNDADALQQAESCAEFLLQKLAREGRLAHSFQEGEPKGEGFLDDYAFVIAGLIDLFEASGKASWLQQALRLSAVVQESFADVRGGGYFMTGPQHEQLIAREKPAYDGVIPSGNSVMIMNLLRLHWLSEEPGFLEQAQGALRAFGSQLASAPMALTEMLLALDFLQDAPRQIAIVAPRGNREAAAPLLERLGSVFVPNRVLVIVCEGEELQRAAELVPFLKGKQAQGDRAVAYLCEDRSCSLPTSDPEEWHRQLRESVERRR